MQIPFYRRSQEVNTSAIFGRGRMHCKLLILGMDGEKLILDESRHPVIPYYTSIITAYTIYFIILFYYILCI